ncbi:Rieske 2Fe-2S domain-containing protein [Gymnodinialimonas sp. 2305UL16-5]|uniref:Rieske 2Fe-2S domain-containing protein n=1 Tax=Gymnodinialimonas mytili TaxID=3126503 RepID=UPI0030ACF057
MAVSERKNLTLRQTGGQWVVVAHSAELDVPRPVVPVSLNGQRYVLFRDEEGALGLIGRNCPHRGADLCFGRLEDNGLRCPFHGWHFDRTGQCVEQPAEPEGSRMYTQIKVPMVPVKEENGVISAWSQIAEQSP